MKKDINIREANNLKQLITICEMMRTRLISRKGDTVETENWLEIHLNFELC